LTFATIRWWSVAASAPFLACTCTSCRLPLNLVDIWYKGGLLKDITILLGDMYAKIGNENTGYEQVMGKHGLGTMNENGKLFANFCANYNLFDFCNNKVVVCCSICSLFSMHMYILQASSESLGYTVQRWSIWFFVFKSGDTHVER
jgi:hypothetical protein